jgi:copper chaperone NosL
MNTKISTLSKVLLLLGAISLVISIFVPIWRIELDAPQYPEGLFLQIYSSKLGGNVDIINGLNHYIGMKTLHDEDFIEFTVLPYIIGFFAVASILVIFFGRKKMLYVLFTLFVLFGILAMYDFWRWEYDYGHNLDPKAAIIVPGMAYQPPLIGFKQLLNFGAYSIPDIGGWLFITSGLLMLTAVIYEVRLSKKTQSKIGVTSSIILLFFVSCGNVEMDPIIINKDHCDFCKMMITDPRFPAEVITKKGRVYKFDDVDCLKSFLKNNNHEYESYFVTNYLPPHTLHNASQLFYVESAELRSPMGGNIAAFTDKQLAEEYANKLTGQNIAWETIIK